MQPAPRTSYSATGPAREDLALTDLLLVVRRRRILILAVAVGLFIVAAGAGLYRGQVYTATGELQIQPGSAADLKQSISVLGGGSTLDVIIESDSRILMSEQLLIKVATKLQLQDDPRFFHHLAWFGLAHSSGTPVTTTSETLDDLAVRTRVLKNLRDHLTIARVPRTQMITISYASRSPELAAKVVNTLESEFIKNNFVAHYSSTQQVTNWLTQQIDDLHKVVQDSQDRMVDLQKRLGISALDPSHSMIVQEIASLEKAAADATAQRVQAEARYQILRSLPPERVQDSPSLVGINETHGLLESLRSQRATTAVQLAHDQAYYGPNYPEIKKLTAQLTKLDLEVMHEEIAVTGKAEDTYLTAKAAEDSARHTLAARVSELYGERDDIAKYELLSEQYESNRHMYESILARLREAAVDAGLDSADISVVDLASLPTEPSSTSPLLMGGLGLVFGAIGGLALALVLERMDTRLRDSRQIQELTGVPAIAVVPQTHWRVKTEGAEAEAGPEILRDGHSPFAESIRVLRTSIQLSSTSRGSRVIAITSCQPAEGKSTLSMNLGAALAQSGKRVILVDADMRRPSVDWQLRLRKGKGLAEFLAGMESLEAVIQKHGTLVNFDVIASGVCPPLPADLLASDQMKQLVETMRERYEYVIFDCPPALSVTDPLIVSSLSDGLVLVVRQGSCTRDMILRAVEIFRDVGVKIYGFVLNGVDVSLPEYYGYLGYYSYEYKN